MTIRAEDGGITIDATLLADLLHIDPAEMLELMRAGEITSVHEQGVDEHSGEQRLTFFHGSKRVRLRMDAGGRILSRSVIDWGPYYSPPRR